MNVRGNSLSYSCGGGYDSSDSDDVSSIKIVAHFRSFKSKSASHLISICQHHLSECLVHITIAISDRNTFVFSLKLYIRMKNAVKWTKPVVQILQT